MNELRAEILVGQRYRFLHRIGTDQNTETWRAFDTRLGRAVALQLLAEEARGNSAAQADLRVRMQGRPDASGPRLRDAGEDPLYGPFLVTELVESPGPTQRLPTLDAAGATPSFGGLQRGPLLLIALIGGILVLVVGAFAVAAYVLEPAKPAPAVAANATLRPLSGAQPGAPPTAIPTVPPTLAAAQQAPAPQSQSTSRPTSPPAVQATVQPTPPASAQVTPGAAAPAKPSAVQAQPSAGSPVDTIRQHYGFIDAKRYAEGYALMDARLRSLNSSAEYQSWFADKVSVKPISVELTAQTDKDAVVRSKVETTDRVNGQNVTRQVSEEFVLHAEDGAWRIDQVSQI